MKGRPRGLTVLVVLVVRHQHHHLYQLFCQPAMPSKTLLPSGFVLPPFVSIARPAPLSARLPARLCWDRASSVLRSRDSHSWRYQQKRYTSVVVEMAMDLAANTRVGFIGAGQMAEAIARGLNRSGIVPADRMYASDVNVSRTQVFESFGTSICSSNIKLAENSNVLILAVKPQVAEKVVTEMRPSLSKDHLLVSIAAGIPIKKLQVWAGDARIVRVMPNVNCLVGETAAGMSLGDTATQADSNLVATMFGSLGKIHVVDEGLLNAVTGISGSGPAYIFMAIEALADGGVASGLTRDVAMSLAAQTVLGSAKMVLESKKHPGELKDMVTSPAGTTIAGIRELEERGFRSALINAVLAGTKRGEELAGK